MRGKKLVFLLGLVLLLATTSGLIWYWWTDTPPKVPLRSKSVMHFIPSEISSGKKTV